jgi:hypothetical protein
MKCIICQQTLEPIHGELQPDAGTVWSSHGNFGSEVFDSIDESEELMIHICDSCLAERADCVHAFRHGKHVPVSEVLNSSYNNQDNQTVPYHNTP